MKCLFYSFKYNLIKTIKKLLTTLCGSMAKVHLLKKYLVLLLVTLSIANNLEVCKTT